MKALERLVFSHFKPWDNTFIDPLQFAYQDCIGVDDTVINLLQRAFSYLDVPGSIVRGYVLWLLQ